MKNVFSWIKRYAYRLADSFGKPAFFPPWCDTGASQAQAGESPRHSLGADGSVLWNVKEDARLPHYDHVEMSGFYAACIASYGADEKGKLRLFRHAVFPMLRTVPNDTGGSLSHNFTESAGATVLVDGQTLRAEYPQTVSLRGHLDIKSRTDRGVELTRRLFPSVNHPAVIEKITVRNLGSQPVDIVVLPPRYRFLTRVSRGVEGAYQLGAGMADEAGGFSSRNSSALRFRLESGGQAAFYQVFYGMRAGEKLAFDAAREEGEREAYVAQMLGAPTLETPEPALNAAFDFAKVRLCESIYKTKNGLMHSPGGGSYYAALWTNDQCEYANPVFPFLGYAPAVEQAENCYRLYMDRMDPARKKALVTSIIAEGEGYWNGAGDRGDGAMFAYGAARFALASGDAAAAGRLWDGIVWGIEYSLGKKNECGVIRSDSDELENRFESGDANLNTSCLVYDALISAVCLGTELKKDATLLQRYQEEAEKLYSAIETFFGANVQGFDTYRYYNGNELLRAWICVPLCMGIFSRAEGTVRALFSDKLWTQDGLRTEQGCDTFWDRATLYCLRGAFAAGKGGPALPRLLDYSRRRLLGEHVPYPVEAWPEGNQKHLAAESALYLRVYLEGLFGIRPVGLKSFELRPQLPESWQGMALRGLAAFGTRFDIEVGRAGGDLKVVVTQNGVPVFDRVLHPEEGAVITLQ